MPTFTLAQLMAMVYTETNRPDLVAETQQAVIASTLALHLRADWRKDIQPAIINFGTPAKLNVLDLTSLIGTGFRRMVYMRPSDSTATITTSLLYPCWPQTTTPELPPLYWGFADWDPSGLIEMIEPDDIFDVNNYQKDQVCYQAGTNLYIRTILPIQYIQAGWLQNPDIDPTTDPVTYNSWIANDYPFAVVYDAAADVFGKTGQADIAQTYRKTESNGTVAGKVALWLDLLDKNETVAGRGK